MSMAALPLPHRHRNGGNGAEIFEKYHHSSLVFLNTAMNLCWLL
jgi:hypothetical protein